MCNVIYEGLPTISVIRACVGNSCEHVRGEYPGVWRVPSESHLRAIYVHGHTLFIQA